MTTTEGFKVGDKVTWTSQAGGFAATKVGEVIEIVPPNTRPNIKGPGMNRDHESYIVRAYTQHAETKRTRKYWPRVNQLARYEPKKETDDKTALD